MPKSLRTTRIHLSKLLILPLPFPRIRNPKPILEHLADRLKRHALDLWEAEDDKQPPEEADAGVEAEGAAGRDALHHAQEGGRDDDVCAPASYGVEHGANGASINRQKLSADLWIVSGYLRGLE